MVELQVLCQGVKKTLQLAVGAQEQTFHGAIAPDMARKEGVRSLVFQGGTGLVLSRGHGCY